MPLLGNNEDIVPNAIPAKATEPLDEHSKSRPTRSQTQHSGIAKTAIMNHHAVPVAESGRVQESKSCNSTKNPKQGCAVDGRKLLGALNDVKDNLHSQGKALTDTPVTTAPNTPEIPPRRRDSGSPRLRPRAATTLDIPGLTKSKVSPDGKISQRDLGSKLVVVMVGLPARGKSYITKKLARYLNWLQHDTRIFNVGERRRVVAGGHATNGSSRPQSAASRPTSQAINGALHSFNGTSCKDKSTTPPTSPSTRILVNGDLPPATPPFERLPPSALDFGVQDEIEISGAVLGNPNAGLGTDAVFEYSDERERMEQSAQFFDPNNERASYIREQLAMETLDELLDFIIHEKGSVGIFDATNSTHERRRALMNKIRTRAGPELGVLFLESLCIDEALLEANMRLKLSGPDYKDQDPVTALVDFKKRVTMYQKKYVSLGEYEEKNNMQFIQMIDVGRKIISHQIRGFLSAQTNYYLLNFNLAPRQIWITRHGESTDNVRGLIGGDSELTETGKAYAQALTAFLKDQRQIWEVRQQDKALSTHFPPQPGDTTPPNPEYTTNDDSSKNFCIWTSMLRRSIQTAQFFDEEDFDVKQMKMLDELNAGMMEGRTYEEIKEKFAEEYE